MVHELSCEPAMFQIGLQGEVLNFGASKHTLTKARLLKHDLPIDGMSRA